MNNILRKLEYNSYVVVVVKDMTLIHVFMFISEVVECEEYLTLSPQQVAKLISSDRLTVPSEEKVRHCARCSTIYK